MGDSGKGGSQQQFQPYIKDYQGSGGGAGASAGSNLVRGAGGAFGSKESSRSVATTHSPPGGQSRDPDMSGGSGKASTPREQAQAIGALKGMAKGYATGGPFGALVGMARGMYGADQEHVEDRARATSKAGSAMREKSLLAREEEDEDEGTLGSTGTGGPGSSGTGQSPGVGGFGVGF